MSRPSLFQSRAASARPDWSSVVGWAWRMISQGWLTAPAAAETDVSHSGGTAMYSGCGVGLGGITAVAVGAVVGSGVGSGGCVAGGGSG